MLQLRRWQIGVVGVLALVELAAFGLVAIPIGFVYGLTSCPPSRPEACTAAVQQAVWINGCGQLVLAAGMVMLAVVGRGLGFAGRVVALTLMPLASFGVVLLGAWWATTP